MTRTLIQKHSSAIIRGFLERVNTLTDLDHKLTKGELRELFVTNILDSFLTSQFGIGSGIIINQAGKQSNQTDIIIYDNRILPPFIKEQNLGVYPAESVLAAIEVKSVLTRGELLAAEIAAKKLKEEVYNPKYSIYRDYKQFSPLCAVIGFYGAGAKELKDNEKGKTWLSQNIQYLFAICLTNNYSWLKVGGKGWAKREYDPKTNEETKRFVSVILDNVRTYSEIRIKLMGSDHKDWLGVYIRDQEPIEQHFRNQES